MVDQILSFGINSKKYWFFLYSGIPLIIRTYTFKSKPIHFFLRSLLMGIGMFLSFIFEFVSRKLQINTEASKKEDKPTPNKKDNIINLATMALVAILDTIGTIMFNYTSNNNDSDDDGNVNGLTFYGESQIHIVIQFILVAIMAGIFLRLRMHKHHYFFSLFMIVGLILILIANIKGFNIQSKFYLGIGWSISHSFYLILNKWLLDFRYKSTFEILGFEGLFMIIFTIIPMFFYIGISSASFSDIFQEANALYVVNIIVYILTTLAYNIFLLLITKHFGPTNRIVTDLFANFVIFIIDLILYHFIEIYMVFLFIGQIVLLVGAIGFNEIVVVYWWGLEENTKKEILKRSGLDELKEDINYVEKQRTLMIAESRSEMQRIHNAGE